MGQSLFFETGRLFIALMALIVGGILSAPPEISPDNTSMAVKEISAPAAKKAKVAKPTSKYTQKKTATEQGG